MHTLGRNARRRQGDQANARRPRLHGSANDYIAGDDFDFRLLDHLVLPLLGKGSEYRSFDKSLVIPGSYFADFSNWSRLALMRNRRTMEELKRLQRQAADPAAIARLIAVIDNECRVDLKRETVGSENSIGYD